MIIIILSSCDTMFRYHRSRLETCNRNHILLFQISHLRTVFFLFFFFCPRAIIFYLCSVQSETTIQTVPVCLHPPQFVFAFPSIPPSYSPSYQQQESEERRQPLQKKKKNHDDNNDRVINATVDIFVFYVL